MIRRILDYLARDGAGLLGAGPAPSSWHFLMTGGRAKTNGRITFLLFADQDRSPSLVARFYRNPCLGELLRGEHDSLEALRAECGPQRAEGLPRPLGLTQIGSRLVMFEEALPGSPITAGLSGHRLDFGRVGRQFVDAAGWLRWLHQLSPEVASTEEWRRDVRQLLDRFSATFGPLQPDESHACRWIREQARDMSGRLPLGWSHGDFCHKNLLRTPDGCVAVLDWQYVVRRAVADRDLAHFPLLYTQYLMARHSQNPLDWFRSQFMEPAGELAPAIRSYLTTYLQASDLPDGFARLSFPLGIIRQLTRIAETHARPLPAAAVELWRMALCQFGQAPDRLLAGSRQH